MSLLLDFVYGLLLAAASPYLLYAAIRKAKYREGYAEKFLGRVPRRAGDRPCIWFHAVSVGEVNLLPQLVARCRSERPDYDVAVSTTTRTGLALAKRRFPDLPVFYCPLDFSWAVRSALRRLRPDVLVLAELEIWPNLIRMAHARGTKVAVINARLGNRSFRGYRRARRLLRSVFASLDLVAVQDETGAERFRQLGVPPGRVQVTGSMKYDGAETNRDNEKTRALRRLAGISPSDVVFLAGSTQQGEEQAALNVFRHLAPEHPQLRLILVPRHPERFEAVARVLDESGLRWTRRSQLDSEPPVSCESRVLLVDTIGELGAWWGTADIALVGGSFGNRGGQNMIEPAAYGAAVCFGPNTWNFRDIVGQLLHAQAACVVSTPAELETFVARCLEDRSFAQTLGARARELVLQHRGATARTHELVSRLLPHAASTPPTRSHGRPRRRSA